MESMESSCVPPGFRFHPTEEELVAYYLKRKINSLSIDLDVIIEIDLYKMEPWDIQDKCKLGYEEQSEWYFFSHKDRKYPTGTRTNRATTAGFWKATGRDKAVISKDRVVGMRKTLVFYKGRAPNGRKTDWIMHEYRLQTSEHGPPQEEGWVVCRAFKKPIPSQKPGYESWNNPYYNISSSSSYYNRPTSYSMSGFDPDLNHGRSFCQPPVPQGTLHETPMADHLPKLDNPSNVSTSFDEKGNISNQFSDWKNFGQSSSYGYTNMNNGELGTDHESHLSHVLDCFPEL